MASVFIGVDPHKLSATIEVVDERETVLATGRFGTDQGGYAAMRRQVAAWPAAGVGGRGQQRRRAAAGAAAAGRRRARASTCPRSCQRGPGCSTPGTTARPTPTTRTRSRSSRCAPRGLRVLSYDERLEALRMLVDRREELTRQRIQTVNRLQRLLSELTPGKAKKDLTALQAKGILAGVRPRDLAGKTRRRLAVEQLTELVAVDKKIKALTKELKVMVIATGSTLMDLPGVGPVVAARVLADVGGCGPVRRPQPVRVLDRNRTDRSILRRDRPPPALPGRQPADEPHDPHRRGHPDPPRHPRTDLLPAQAHRGQDPDGGHALPEETHLRRHLPPAARRRHRRRGCGRQDGPGRAPRGVFRIQRGRLTPAHRHFGSATSRTRTHDATGRHDPREPPPGIGSPANAPTRRSRQGGAPHRTNDLDGDKRRRTLKGAEPGPLTTEGSRSDAGRSRGYGRPPWRCAARRNPRNRGNVCGQRLGSDNGARRTD